MDGQQGWPCIDTRPFGIDETLSLYFWVVFEVYDMYPHACSTPLLPCSLFDLHHHEPSQANRNGKKLSRVSGRLSFPGMLALPRLPDPLPHFVL